MFIQYSTAVTAGQQRINDIQLVPDQSLLIVLERKNWIKTSKLNSILHRTKSYIQEK